MSTDSLPMDVLHIRSGVLSSNEGLPPNFKDILLSTFGSINDPEFGRVDAGCAFEFKTFSSAIKFGNNASFDSLELQLCFFYSHGDLDFTHKLEVYELQDRLPEANIDGPRFYSFQKPVYKPQELCGLKAFKVKQPTNVDTSTKIRFKLSDELGRRILNAPEASLIDDNAFLEFFKGIYIKTPEVNTPSAGAMHCLSVLNKNTSLRLHYKYDKDTTVFDSTLMKNVDKVIRKTNFFDFNVDLTSRDIRTLQRTAMPQSIYDRIVNQKTEIDKFALVQSVAPLSIKVEIPNFKTVENKVVNYADLTFKVDPTFENSTIAKPPKILFLYGTVLENGKLVSTPYRPLATALYDSLKKEYKFICTTYLQQIILGREPNAMILTGFDYQTVDNGTNRAVIGNYNHLTLKPSLRILYTEIPK